MSLPLLAVLAVAVIVARAVFLRLRAAVRALARKARWFGWGAACGALAAMSAHAPAALVLAAATALAAVLAARMLGRPGAARRAAA